jgi:hypothetical protein
MHLFAISSEIVSFLAFLAPFPGEETDDLLVDMIRIKRVVEKSNLCLTSMQEEK